MADSQIYTEPPMDITTEMMSPATTALLANMNVSIASATGSCSRGGASMNNSIVDNSHDSLFHAAAAAAVPNDDDAAGKRRRRPLGAIQNTNNNNATAAATTNTNTTRVGGSSSSINKRTMGPNEATYRQHYDTFVTKSITRYSARMQTNLRHEILPNYVQMSVQEKSAALARVDQLLGRLSVGGGTQSTIASSNNNSGSMQTSTQHNDTTFGSATTLGEGHHNDTFGSATTLGISSGGLQGQQHNETFGSATTLGEHQDRGDKRQSTDSATTLGNNKSMASSATTTMGDEAGGVDQSVSLLEESMCLLSDDDEVGGGGNTNNDNGNDETRASAATGPIEQTRHYQNNPHNSTTLAPDDGEMLLNSSKTPPFSTHKHPSKRCASNSGKRGLKSRHRSSIEDDADDDDSLLLGQFNGIGGSDSGMFLHDQDDAFSCGSPIQRRFSNDGLEILSDCCEGDDNERRDGLRDLPISEHDEKRNKSHVNNGDESDSRFSLQDDENDDVSFNGGNDDYYNDDYDDDDDNDGGLQLGGGSGNWNESSSSQRPIHTQNQLSQWSTFRNADAQLTSSQMMEYDNNGGEQHQDDEDESPVRRRAILFDGASQAAAVLHSQRRSQRSSSSSNNLRGGTEKVMTSTAKGQGQQHKQSSKKKCNGNGEDDDPIQTVRNLCRRAKSLEEQGVDSSLLEEVAPIDVRLRDGMHFRMDPLRCRQDKDKNSKSKSKSSSNTTKKVSIVHPKGKSKSKKAVRAAASGAAAASRSRCESSDSEQSLSDPEPSFKDPISDFPTRVAARLNAGLSFLMDKEGDQSGTATQNTTEEVTDDQGHASAVLLSMTVRQIVCVTSKLLIQTIKSTRTHQRAKNGQSSAARKRFTPSCNAPTPKDNDYLAGGTLIVLRGKEDIAQWEVALREFTGMSVLNHHGLPSTLRKLASTAGKCAGFDVVLTTYDALKSKEVTIPVDCSGCAILGGSAAVSNSNDGGWLTARDAGTQSGAAAPQKCHQLSVLHRMSWFRVIFMDVLGRKGFLTKPGTARAQAAVAINSKTRSAFFEKEEDATSKAEAKFKDDRRQLRSIITALHLPERMKLDKLIGTYILDVNQVGKTKEANRRDSSSSDDDEYVSENESCDDNLADPW